MYVLCDVVHSSSKLGARYIFVAESRNWADAQRICETRHQAKLVIIANQVDQLRLHTFINTVPGQNRCISGTHFLSISGNQH